FYHLQWVRAQTAADRTKFATRELEQAERAVERSNAEPDWYRASLLMAAKAAIEANDVGKARQFATTALAQGGSRNDNKTGQTLHDSHVVLSRVATAGSIVVRRNRLVDPFQSAFDVSV